MRSSDVSRRGIVSGAVVVLIGAFVVIEALSFRIGTARSMGPGYFPIVLGILMIGLGLTITVTEFRQKEPEESIKPSYRPFLMVVTSIAAFALMIRPFGLLPTIFATVFLSALADPRSKIKTSFYIALFLTIFVVIVFKYGLGFQASIISFGDYWRIGE